MVYLVGAGPGDPGLLTLRAVQCLHRADVVLYDYLVNPAVLDHASARAELVPLGRKGVGARAYTPVEIEERMVAEALAGRTVVRLKGGDPSVFGRGSDETGALRRAGVPFEIVPGITTGLAVAAYCEIPITQQDDASAVALVAGRERDDKAASALDYDALAAFPGTLVFYMGVGRVGEWSPALIERGKPADTPVGIVRWCSRAGQETVFCTLGTAVDVVRERGLAPPAVFVVGDVVARAPARSWFAMRPLAGRRVLLPGSRGTSRRLRERFAELGAEVLESPTLRVVGPPDPASVDAALGRLDHYDWIVFASPHGVDRLLGRLSERGGDARRLAAVRLAALGTGAAERLARLHLHADLVPQGWSARPVARALVEGRPGARVLLVRGSGGDELARALAAEGATVDEVVAYAVEPVESPDQGVAAALARGDLDWIVVTSGAAARSLATLYGPSIAGARLASVGPLASSALRELGLAPSVEASPHTAAALVEGVLRAELEERAEAEGRLLEGRPAVDPPAEALPVDARPAVGPPAVARPAAG